MSISKDKARALLKAHDLRATGPRMAVLRALARAGRPLSYTEVVELLGETDWDQATVFRNLVKLRDAGITTVVSRVDGMDRYALVSAEHGTEHRHPHFVCEDCGRIDCLPDEIIGEISLPEPWRAAVADAVLQMRGVCPTCRASA